MRYARRPGDEDAVTLAAGECGLPVIYSGLCLNTNIETITEEMRRTLADDRIAAFNLYETRQLHTPRQGRPFHRRPTYH